MCVPGACRSQKVYDPLELELEMTELPHGYWEPNSGSLEKQLCSYSVIYLSSPGNLLLILLLFYESQVVSKESPLAALSLLPVGLGAFEQSSH